jgi:ADP-ribose pyrophosphatase YjhB (NUDIX family)
MIINYKKFPSSGKQYVYLQDGKKKIFLRNVLFIRHASKPAEIVTVREWGSKTERGAWEPPKGQMEWKELAETGIRAGQDVPISMLVEQMRKGVLREIAEEAKILPSEIKGLKLLPMSYTDEFPAAGPNAYFRYQFWEGTLGDLRPAQKRLRALTTNADWSAMLPDDVKEKDAVEWWSPTGPAAWGKIRGAFSLTMTRMYYDTQKK